MVDKVIIIIAFLITSVSNLWGLESLSDVSDGELTEPSTPILMEYSLEEKQDVCEIIYASIEKTLELLEAQQWLNHGENTEDHLEVFEIRLSPPKRRPSILQKPISKKPRG